MDMKRILMFVLMLMTCAAVAPRLRAQDEGMTPQELQKRLEYLYRTAMEYEHQNKYSSAIYYYKAILNLDPTQVQPPKRIGECRKQIEEQTRPVYEKVKAFYRAGEYIQAQEKILLLLDIDAANKNYQRLYNRLQEVADIFTVVTKDDKVSRILRLAVSQYLNKPQDVRLAYNFARYAAELQPGRAANAKQFMRLLSEEYETIILKEKPVKGMNFVEQSLFVALNQIYDGRYDLALRNCEEVLQLEPNNLLALKRMGSAFYALGNKLKAREIWEKALRIVPDDRELINFLKKAK